ncbi:hypothetical protein GCM10010277_54530 [Streptomyces longisporoflavus]|uniref:hypothetical protein n=1 Tax=Streptomyces longisporoflavus TaxID=28044 RepID=UPI00167D89CB|nr:hypothetical protein [Streptomyces longisporoflavus]GGV55035.1 hypothetical protein GCM10010277_54530 [Streptomyces longisporoflavus]
MHVRNVRIGAAAAGLVAALALTGCSSDGGDGGDEGKDKGSAGSSAGAEGSSDADAPDEGSDPGSDSGSDSGAKDGSSEGSWVATSGGNPLALVIAGKQATLLGENVLCSGTTAGDALKLKCAKGDSTRTDGTVESVNGTSMTVSWQGAGKDQFTKTEGGKLPEGLPTAGLPQS